MKKLTNLFCVLFAILVTVASCSPTDVSIPDTTVNQSESVTLKRIQEYNKVMKQQSPQSRGRINKKDIACADILGAFEGIGAGKTLAGVFGIATGGTGYAATIIGMGILGGAAKSYLKYRECTGYSVRIDDFYKYSLNQINANLKSDTTNYYKKYIYSPKAANIKLPPKFQSMVDVGEAHNKLILGVNYSAPNPTIPVTGPIDNWVPPTFTSDKKKVELALNSKDAKAQFDKIMARVTGQDLDIDAYFENYPTGSKRSEQALKSYLDLFQTYPDNVDDVIKITNDYVEIIESSNEFTDDEKAMIYAALMVSIYSPQIWNGFE